MATGSRHFYHSAMLLRAKVGHIGLRDPKTCTKRKNYLHRIRHIDYKRTRKNADSPLRFEISNIAESLKGPIRDACRRVHELRTSQLMAIARTGV